MNETVPSPAFQHDEQSSGQAWLKGFLAIFTAPYSAGRIPVSQPFRPIVFSVLLFMVAIIGSEYLVQSNEALVRQQMMMKENDLRAIGQYARIGEEELQRQIDDIRAKTDSTFSLPVAMAWGVIYGFGSVLVVGVLFWILQRLFNAEPPPFFSTLAVVSFGNAVTSTGLIVMALSQYLSDSVFVSPSLAFLTAPLDRTLTLTHTLLSKINIFTIWEYLAVGIAVAGSAGMKRATGLLFGIVAFLFVFGMYSVFLWLYMMLINS